VLICSVLFQALYHLFENKIGCEVNNCIVNHDMILNITHNVVGNALNLVLRVYSHFGLHKLLSNEK